MTAKVDLELCTGCGICARACPVDAIIIDNGKAKINADKCTGCGVCEDECPRGAIHLE